MADHAATGEFEGTLRAQIADARAQLELARAAKDLEATTSLALRLRYLLEVAEDVGFGLAQAHAAEGAGE